MLEIYKDAVTKAVWTNTGIEFAAPFLSFLSSDLSLNQSRAFFFSLFSSVFVIIAQKRSAILFSLLLTIAFRSLLQLSDLTGCAYATFLR